MRNDYQVLIVEHTSHCCSIATKDIDEVLWKQCFYRQIEDYRKSIRKTVQLLDQSNATTPNANNSNKSANNSATATLTSSEMGVKAKTHLARLTAAFIKFLSDGSMFYQDLMLKVRRITRGGEGRRGE